MARTIVSVKKVSDTHIEVVFQDTTLMEIARLDKEIAYHTAQIATLRPIATALVEATATDASLENNPVKVRNENVLAIHQNNLAQAQAIKDAIPAKEVTP